MKYCTKCGTQLDDDVAICTKCGKYVAAKSKTAVLKSGKSKIVYGVLAILLGGIGIHMFYIGRIGLGVLMFLFAWTLIPGVIGLIQGILHLCESDEEFDGYVLSAA